MSRFAFSRFAVSAAFFGFLMMFSSCARYSPSPLPATPDLASVPALTVPASEFMLPGLKPHSFSASGLDETSVVTLAVFNDPMLKAARLQEGVASAQLFAAGLLPDPVVSANFAESAVNYGGGLGLSQEIEALRTRGAARAAAGAHVRQVRLNILWQEWQVAEKARELFIQARTDAELGSILSASRDLLARRYRQDRLALGKGNLTLGPADADLALLVQSETNLRQVQLDANLARQSLNQLLGLKPDVRLHLIGPVSEPPLSPAKFKQALASLPRRRADLLALRAGYRSQEETLREAILAQFPALTAGVTLTRDPLEGLNAFGPAVTLSLPLFNRNRGQIAVARATRALLRQTYQARLDQAVGNAHEVWHAAAIMQSQLRDLDARLPVLKTAAEATERNLREYKLNAGLYVNVESSYLAAEANAVRLRASLATAQSALEALLGLRL